MVTQVQLIANKHDCNAGLLNEKSKQQNQTNGNLTIGVFVI
jgi:hypothetical protein